MEKLFIIDTENIGNNQYDGLNKLSKKDKVVFIMSRNSKGLQGEIMNDIINCKAIKESILVDVGAKNALDFQLIAYLSIQIQKNKKCNEYYIVSQDKGYDIAVNFLNQQTTAMVKRINNFNISSSASDEIYIKNSSDYDDTNVIPLNILSEKNILFNTKISLEDFLEKEIKFYTKKTLRKIASIIYSTDDINNLDNEMFKVFNNHKVYETCKDAIHKYYSSIS